MRETKYAVELTEPAVRQWPNGEEARIEKLHIRESGEEEIRFSWWKGGKIVPRPLDLSENDLLLLLKDAFSKDVFTPLFKEALRKLI